jgi:hypothetical protein
MRNEMIKILGKLYGREVAIKIYLERMHGLDMAPKYRLDDDLLARGQN